MSSNIFPVENISRISPELSSNFYLQIFSRMLLIQNLSRIFLKLFRDFPKAFQELMDVVSLSCLSRTPAMLPKTPRTQSFTEMVAQNVFLGISIPWYDQLQPVPAHLFFTLQFSGTFQNAIWWNKWQKKSRKFPIKYKDDSCNWFMAERLLKGRKQLFPLVYQLLKLERTRARNIARKENQISSKF